jgi:hypothetical protein
MQTDPVIFGAKLNTDLDIFIWPTSSTFFIVYSEKGFVNELKYFRFQCGPQKKENWHGWFSAPPD